MPAPSSSAAHDGEEARELREDERLVPALPDLGEPGQERVELRARLAEPRAVEEPGMAGGLPEPEQRLEHLDLRPPEPVAPDLAEQRRAVVVAQLVVELALRGLELAVQRLLGLGGEVLRDLLLRAPQDEGPQAAGDDGHRVGIEAPGRRSVGAEGGRRAQHARVQELEQAPQLAQMVLDRRAAERQAMVAAQQARRLGGLGARVLDGLGLVEDHVVEADVLQEGRVAAQRAVGGEHEVVVLEVLARADAPGARVVEHAQLGREPRRLLLPVEHERARHHDERRPGPLAALVDRRGLARRAARSSSASTCTVLPRPMSSARQPPKPKRSRKCSQPSPSR